MAERQLQYGALQSALETEAGLRLAAAWEPAGRTIGSTSLAMGGHLTVLAPPDVERLPAGSAGALRNALRAGVLVVVTGDVAKATAWWTVARSGFVRAIMETGAGMSKLGGAGRRVVRKPPPTPVGRQRHGGGNEYGTVESTAEGVAEEGAEQVGHSVQSKFSDVSAAQIGKMKTLLGG
jgi:hypothetical protein